MNTPLPEETSPESIDLRQYAYLLWHWAWLIALAALLAGAAAYLVSRQQTPIYQAATTVMVNEAPSSQGNDYTSVLVSEQLTQTYSQLAVTQPILEQVAARLGLGLSGANLAGIITVQPVRDTQLIQITVRLEDPALAAAIANTLAQVFSEQIRQMQSDRFSASLDSLQAQMADVEAQIAALNAQAAKTTSQTEKARLDDKLTQYRQIYSQLLLSFEQVRLAEAQTVSTVLQVEPATTPTFPVSPKTGQNTLLAALVGAMLAVGAVFLIETLDDTIRDPEMLLRRYNLTVLGVIAHHEAIDGDPIVQRHPRSPVAEAFRSLRTNVQYASVDHPLRTLLITSPTPSDGKSTITCNLAVVLAHTGLRVTVIDADLRRPMLHRMLGVENLLGLSAIFRQSALHLNGHVQRTKTGNVSVISSGELPPNPAELLGSKKMREILDLVRERCDMLLIDTPPVLSVTDAVVLAPAVDGVILVIKPGTTRQAALKQALAQLNQVGARILGVVINEVGARGTYYNYYYRRYYKQHYQYAYAYSDDGKKKKKVRRPQAETSGALLESLAPQTPARTPTQSPEPATASDPTPTRPRNKG